MKLDRNIEGNDGTGKYALLLLRKLKLFDDGKTFGGLAPKVAAALETLEDAGVVDWGYTNSDAEFFLIRLKDRNAQAALRAYATEAARTDPQWANEVFEMANRAGPNSPHCKTPD